MLKAGSWTLLILSVEAIAILSYFHLSWWWALAVLATLFCAIVFTWLNYLAVMNLKPRIDDGTITTPQKVLAVPFGVVAYILFDGIICNIVIGHAMFFGVRHLTLSATVSDFKFNRRWSPEDPRVQSAKYICFHFLDPFDRRPDGLGHCRA